MRFLVGISLLLVFHPSLGLAEQFRVGPVYIKQGGVVSVVIELPPGLTPTAADFHLLADGNPMATAQEIKSFRDSLEDLAIAVCVDVSGTMARGPLDDVKEALLVFLGKARARPRDKLALIAFADEEKIVSSFEKTRDQLDDAVRNLKSRGHKTRLYQTVYKALDMLQGADLPKRRRIIVISDGKDEGSTEDLLSVTKKATTLGIPIDTVGRGRIEKQFEAALSALSDTTGGQFVYARPDRLALTDALDRIYNDLLETRSLVVYFKYEADKAGSTIQNGLIELKQLSQPISRGQIPGPIPALMPVKPPSIIPKLLGLLGVVLLGVGLAVLVRRRPKSQGPLVRNRASRGPKETEPESPVVVPRKPDPPLDVPAEGPRKTQVGSYYFPVPKPGQPTAVLIGVSGPVEGQQFSVDKEIFHIGASPENDLLIADDEYVSGEHAYIRYEKGSCFIVDKGSRNGTFVNQHAVTNAGFALSLGDHIQVGISTFEVGMAPS